MSALVHLDGADVRVPTELVCDVVVVGSGPAGAAAARHLARAGASVIVVEEGPAVDLAKVPQDAFGGMAATYRDAGASMMLGRAPAPYVQASALGGTSVVNGAISWRLPRDVHDGWVTADGGLADAIPWAEIDELHGAIEDDLGILPTDPAIAGRNASLLGRGAEAMGLAHRPIARNVTGCEGLARCLAGCPRGHKNSMERTYLPDAVAAGARILVGVRVDRVIIEGDKATGIVGTAVGGGQVTVRAGRAVILAASAVQSPLILLASGIAHGPVGRHFRCHPGLSLLARFPEPVELWRGATQGHEITGMRAEGIKYEALSLDVGVLAARLPGTGRALAASVERIDRVVCWGAAIRAQGEGRVRRGWRRPVVTWDPTAEDVRRYRRSLAVLGRVAFAAGAEVVHPGVAGFPDTIADLAALDRLETEGPLDPRAYTAVATHLFGTCRMGSKPGDAVVRPDFRHHAVDRLYVADSSVFPTNTGVNPQTSILALATICARRVAA